MLKTIESFHFDFQGDLFVDIGGNVGMWTKEVYPFYNKIVFIEPSEEALTKAKENINDTDNKVEYVKKICSSTNTENKSIWTPSSDPGQFTVFGNVLYEDNFAKMESDIATIKLDDLIIENEELSNVFVKIDTEGSDLDVILGGKKFIEKYKPTLAVEFHFHMYWDADKYKEIIDFLNLHNYSLTEFKFPGYRGEPHRLFDGKHNGLEMYDRHYHALFQPQQL